MGFLDLTRPPLKAVEDGGLQALSVLAITRAGHHRRAARAPQGSSGRAFWKQQSTADPSTRVSRAESRVYHVEHCLSGRDTVLAGAGGASACADVEEVGGLWPCSTSQESDGDVTQAGARGSIPAGAAPLGSALELHEVRGRPVNAEFSAARHTSSYSPTGGIDSRHRRRALEASPAGAAAAGIAAGASAPDAGHRADEDPRRYPKVRGDGPASSAAARSRDANHAGSTARAPLSGDTCPGGAAAAAASEEPKRCRARGRQALSASFQAAARGVVDSVPEVMSADAALQWAAEMAGGGGEGDGSPFAEVASATARQRREAKRARERAWLKLLRELQACSTMDGSAKAAVAVETTRMLLASKLITANERHLGAAVAVCVKAGAMGEAEEIMALARQAGGPCSPNSLMYAMLAHGYCKAGLRQAAYGVLQVMEKEGVKPDVALYNALLQDELLPAGVQMLMEQMQSAGVRPNERSFSIAIGCFGRAGQVEAAEAYWEQMVAMGVEPTSYTYNCLMNALADGGHAGKCERLLAEMRAAGLQPTLPSHNIVTKAFGRRGDVAGASAALEEMRGRGVAPSIVTYNAVLDAHIRGRRAEQMEALARELPLRGLAATPATYSKLLRAAGLQYDAAGVRRVLRDMEAAGCLHNVHTYRQAVFALVRCGEGGAALQMLEQMTAAGHPPAMLVADVLIKSVDAALFKACTQAAPGGGLRSFLEEMTAAGLAPTAATAGSLVRRLAASRGLVAALDVTEQLLDAGVGPLGERTWDVLGAAAAAGLERAERQAFAAADRLLSLMRREGAAKSRAVYESAIEARVRSGDGAGALELHQELQEALDAEGGAYSVDQILLATVDAALTGALAADVLRAPEAVPGGGAAAVAAAAERGAGGQLASGIFEDLAAAGIRVKSEMVNNVIKKLASEQQPGGGGGPRGGGRRPGVELRRPVPEIAAPPRSGAPPPAGGPGPGPEAAAGSRSQWLDRALALVDGLPKLLDLQPSTYMYTSLMEACTRKGQPAEVETLWRKLHAGGLQPDAATWIARVRALSAAGGVGGRVGDLLQEAAASRLELDTEVLRALLRACSQAGDTEGAAYIKDMLGVASRRARSVQVEPLCLKPKLAGILSHTPDPSSKWNQ